MQANTTIVEEMTAAARGVLALIVGNRQAADHFDFSQRGLAGSFIALLSAIWITVALPALVGQAPAGGSVFREVASLGIGYAFEVGAAAIVLRQLKRLDAFVPYLVASNWASALGLLAQLLAAILGLPVEFAVIVLGVAGLVITINIARLVVTLTPLQVAIFLIMQLVGASIALLFIGNLFPISPAELEAIGVSSQPA